MIYFELKGAVDVINRGMEGQLKLHNSPFNQ